VLVSQRSKIWCNYPLRLATERGLWDAAGRSAAPYRGDRDASPLTEAGAKGEWPVTGVEARQGRRSRVAGARTFSVKCWFDEPEIAAIRAAAEREGAAAGSWLSSVGVRAAREECNPLDADWREVMGELMALRRQARTIGGLLNQVAAAWNATGELAPQAGRVLGMVKRIVTDVDVVTARARARLR
jgi:hypothetical protein